MMVQTKYKIGEFSRLGRVTVRTLRHYEKIGLLKPGIKAIESKIRTCEEELHTLKTLPEYPTAICMKVYGPYTRLRENYIELFAEIARMGYEIADAPRACYVDGIWNQEDPEKWLTIIQVPVRK